MKQKMKALMQLLGLLVCGLAILGLTIWFAYNVWLDMTIRYIIR